MTNQYSTATQRSEARRVIGTTDLQRLYDGFTPFDATVTITQATLCHRLTTRVSIPAAVFRRCDLSQVIFDHSDLRCVEFIDCLVDGLVIRKSLVFACIFTNCIGEPQLESCFHEPYLRVRQ